MNVQKYTRNQAGNILTHCNRADPTRTYGNQQIDTSKTYLNYNLAIRNDDMTDFEFMKHRCEELNIFKRKDVNYMASWVVTLPQDFKGELKDFFKESYNYLSNKYGEENVISSYIHLDETTPHMHFCFVPTVFDEKKQRLKVNAKECINKMELQTIHKKMQNYLESKLNTEVNILNNATVEGNKTIKELKKQEILKNKAIEELKDDSTIKEAVRKELKSELEEELQSINEELKESKQEFKSIRKDIETSNKNYNELEEKRIDNVLLINKQQQQISENDKRLQEQKETDYYKDLKKENESLKEELKWYKKVYKKFINIVANIFVKIINTEQEEEAIIKDIRKNFEDEPLVIQDLNKDVNDLAESESQEM